MGSTMEVSCGMRKGFHSTPVDALLLGCRPEFHSHPQASYTGVVPETVFYPHSCPQDRLCESVFERTIVVPRKRAKRPVGVGAPGPLLIRPHVHVWRDCYAV